MRSRYTAYVRGDDAYIERTWHPQTRPARVVAAEVNWRGLEVIATTGGAMGDRAGTVTFVAHYEDDEGRADALRETSRFTWVDGAWYYVDGDIS